MRTTFLLFALLVFSAANTSAGTVVDRIVAKVNRQVILNSDWEEELGFECLMSGHSLAKLTREERKAALDRLIDQQLLSQQMHSPEFGHVSPEEIDHQIKAIKSQLLDSGAQPSWETVLAGYGLTEKMVKKHVALELDQLHFIHLRLRPSIQIAPSEIETYYREQLVGKLPVSAKAPSLEEASFRIRELLAEEKINQLLNSWLKTLRSQAQIETLFGEPAGAKLGGK